MPVAALVIVNVVLDGTSAICTLVKLYAVGVIPDMVMIMPFW